MRNKNKFIDELYIASKKEDGTYGKPFIIKGTIELKSIRAEKRDKNKKHRPKIFKHLSFYKPLSKYCDYCVVSHNYLRVRGIKVVEGKIFKMKQK